MLKRLEKKFGLKLANGQDNLKGKIIRLAHMGHVDQFDILSAIAGVELVLHEMGYPVEFGKGLAAAKRAGLAILHVHAGGIFFVAHALKDRRRRRF